MNYEDTVEYLYNSAPLFQNVGGAAYKEGLSNTHILDEHFDHPHQKFKTIHIAGTNGKGSCAHTIAAMLQNHGLRVGLYTSPHLIDFRERIRINGEPVSKDYVVNFVQQEKEFFEPLHPSFFEITTAMAFKYFADEEVDVAVIEVGLGGRLDCTNIIAPELSVITNISLDHTQFLGSTLAEIATEKAGIIKQDVPVVIGETTHETREVFEQTALRVKAPITFAEDEKEILSSSINAEGLRTYTTRTWGAFCGELVGECQIRNTNTLLCAAKKLCQLFGLTKDDVLSAFRNVCKQTGLMGRWQTISTRPTTICDTGHNTGGWQYLSQQLKEAVNHYSNVRIVFGMAADKDVEEVIKTLPKEAIYYWTRATVRRAMDENDIALLGASHELQGNSFKSVAEAYEAAIADAQETDFIYIGGSCFIVADLLKHLKKTA